MNELYQKYALSVPESNSDLLRKLVQSHQPFSGARQPERSTMSIASPYDKRDAEIARQSLPQMVKDLAMFGANFAPGSGEYLSVKESAEATAKAREAIDKGDYITASAQGLNAVVNAVGSMPIAHQIMALGKGAVGVAKGLMGAEHIIPAITTYHGSPTSGIRKWDLNFRGTGEGRLPIDSPARESFTDMIGHGLYSAEKEGIAKGYQDRLSDTYTSDFAYHGQDLNKILSASTYKRLKNEISNHLEAVEGFLHDESLSDDAWWKISKGEKVEGDEAKNALLSAVRNAIEQEKSDLRYKGYGGETTKELNELKSFEELVLKAGKYGIEGGPANKGALYTTELTPHPDEFLLWDKPLSEQPKGVKAVLAPAKTENTYRNNPVYKEGEWDIVKEPQGWVGYHSKSGNRVAADSVEGVMDALYPTSEGLYRKLSQSLGSDKAASEYLNSLGIRGIKYEDGNSRGKSGWQMIATKNGKVISDKNFATQEQAEQAGKNLQGGVSGVSYEVKDTANYNYVMFNPAEEAIITHENGKRIPGAVEEAYRKLRDPKSKAIMLERYPELKDLDKPLVNSLGNPIPHAENFKNWYKDAELLDTDKNPQVLFHSTKNVFDEFAPKYKDSMIFTTTNPEFASRWTYGSGGNRERTVGDLIDEELVKKAQAEWRKTVDWDRIQRETDAGDFAYFDEIRKLDPSRQLDRNWWHSSVMPVYVNAKKIFDPRKDYKKIEPMLENIEGLQDIIKNNMHKEGNWLVYERPEVTEWLQSNGYDGIRLAENVGGDHETIAVFNPKNIKSIYNRGTYDPNDANISKAEGGYVNFADGGLNDIVDTETALPMGDDNMLEELIRMRDESERASAQKLQPVVPTVPNRKVIATPLATRKVRPVSFDLNQTVTEASGTHKVPYDLIHSIIHQESGGKQNALSRKGAYGRMQVMPATFKAMGYTDYKDPRQNIMAGTQYFKEMLNQFGSIELALAAYNAGPTNVRKYNGIPPFPETQNYVRKVMEQYKLRSKGKKYADGGRVEAREAVLGYDPAEIERIANEVLSGDATTKVSGDGISIPVDQTQRAPVYDQELPPNTNIMLGAHKVGDYYVGVNALKPYDAKDTYLGDVSISTPVGKKGKAQIGAMGYKDPYASDYTLRAMYNAALGDDKYAPQFGLVALKSKYEKNPRYGATLSIPFAEGGRVFKRNDGTDKGMGYFGALPMRDGSGRVATEIGIGVNLGGREVEIPTLVPTLDASEIDYLLSGNKPTSEIINKAVEHARQRMSEGKSPFADSGTFGYADGGQVKSLQQMYEDAMLLTQPDYNSKMNEFMDTKAPPFSGGRKFNSSTMGIATPQDVQFADEAKNVASQVGQEVYANTLEVPVNRLKSWGTLINPNATEGEKRVARDYIAPPLFTPEGEINHEGMANEAGMMLGMVSPMAMKKLKGAWGDASSKMAQGATWDDVKGQFNRQLEREFKSGEIGTDMKELKTGKSEYVPTGKLNAQGDPIYKRVATDVKSDTGRYTPSDYMDSLVFDPWFNDMHVFDKLRIFSEVERAYTPTRSKTYQETQSLAQNKKLAGSNIVAVDTIRGCENNCPSCFANAGGGQGNVIHTALVKQRWKGKLDPKNILRVGEVGDPASDWAYSNQLVSKAINRSKGTSFDNNVFGITKLQNIDNFDPTIWRNLEVSLDPLMPDHMAITMNNIKAIKDIDPTVNIVARVRSFKSLNPELMAQQQKAVDFAKDMGIEILETKLRFKNKNYLKVLELDPEAYSQNGSQVVYKKDSVLKDVGNKDADITLCGEGDIKGRCLACRGCERLGSKTLPKEWKGTAEYYENQLDKGNISLSDYEEAMRSIHNKARGGFVRFADGGMVGRPTNLQEYYEKYHPPIYDDSANMRALMSAKPEPFSGARQVERSTMGIASPYDIKSAEIARQTLPKMASGVGTLIAGFAPGSGEYLSAQQSAEDTQKAREAFEQGNYLDASAHGVSSLVNAVGTIPLLHQGIALGKGLLTGGHMLMAGAPFFSKLEHTINTKMGGKSSIDDLIRMAKNNGVSDAEINSTIRGLEGTVTKQQALDTVRARQPEFKDVVLGGKNSDILYEAPSSWGDSSAMTMSEWEKTIPENEIDGKKTGLYDWYKAAHEESAYDEYGDYTGNELSWDKWREGMLDELKPAENPTHFSEYTTPGAKEESYREMFVTAPAKRETVVADNDSTSQRMFGKPYGELDANDQKIIDNYISEYQKPYEKVGARWYDGHSQYDDIENPVVRIRFNDRDVDGKKVLFVEEMQGPSATHQDKMPEELRNRIYDIGTKRVLNYAKENGYDGVAWTTGDMQANRYDLSKHIGGISYKLNRDNTHDIDVSGINGEHIETYYNQKPSDIESLVGKEIANKIIKGEGDISKGDIGWVEEGGDEGIKKTLSGLDLRVGGEGLKSLYDRTLPSMFKKYGKGQVGEAKINTINDKTESVPYIPITDKTPDSFPKFADGGAVRKPTSLEEYYSKYNPPEADSTNLRNLMSARPEPFSTVGKSSINTMGIASPYDRRDAEIARQTLPEMAKDVGTLVANFAPGSGEYLSAKQSAESTAKAREAIDNGDYLTASAQGLDAVVNAVGSLPIAHQIMAAGKALLGGSHMMMGVIKPKGGNWLKGTVEGYVERYKTRPFVGEDTINRAAGRDLYSEYRNATVDQHRNLEKWTKENYPEVYEKLLPPEERAVNDWVDKKLVKYIKNDLATPEDPIRLLAERDITHAPEGFAQYSDEWLGLDQLYPNRQVGKSDNARGWENASDFIIDIGTVPYKERTIEDIVNNPWLQTLPKETPVYKGGWGARLEYGHLIDELRNASRADSGLPRHLRIDPKDLYKVSMPQAVERVDAINKWRKENKLKADLERANNAATVTHKEYPEQGMRWAELKLPESEGGREALSDALKYEGDTMGHCVGGYCNEVVGGRTKIYSLRDSKGEPHVTIEVRPSIDPDISDEIIQIKGKGNAKPAGKYIPFVQDFVKSKDWASVGDLKNTDLVQFNKSYVSPSELELMTNNGWVSLSKLAEGGASEHDPNSLLSRIVNDIIKGNADLSEYYNIRRIGKAKGGYIKSPLAQKKTKGYATGGSVAVYDPSEIDAIANQVREGIYG